MKEQVWRLFKEVAGQAILALSEIEDAKELGYSVSDLYEIWDDQMDTLFKGVPDDIQREVWSLCDQYFPVVQELNAHNI